MTEEIRYGRIAHKPQTEAASAAIARSACLWPDALNVNFSEKETTDYD